MYLCTVNEKMGIVLRLVEHVFVDVYPFLMFYIFTVFIFGICYRVLGVDPDEKGSVDDENEDGA